MGVARAPRKRRGEYISPKLRNTRGKEEMAVCPVFFDAPNFQINFFTLFL